ncbi:MAG: hypothetical protein JJ863_14095 [Deltaproteobacteria bacterium]|nr:hypothetical protein [Deltaproteobacteria bacterium]
MSAFDYLIALDGHGLNGFEGYGGVARLRYRDDAWSVDAKFHDGFAGGHATQLNPSGTVGFLGNLSQTLLFYDPSTLEEIRRFSTLRFGAGETFYASQTHVAWLGDRTFVTPIGRCFYRFDLESLERPEILGEHGVTLPHALKRSPSGRYLFYGAMDHDERGYANQVGIFDLRTGTARTVSLPATAWHLGVHPTEDRFYAPTQRCVPQNGSEFNEYLAGHFKDYLFEIDGEEAMVTRHLTIPKDAPGGGLTSDVVVTEDEVLYNSPFSGCLSRVDLETFTKVRTVDERPSALETLRHLPAVIGNLTEAFARTNLPDQTHSFLKALRMSRGSALDGSYGLKLSPDRRFLLSAHRGLNEVIVYDYPSLTIHRRVPFPPIQSLVPHIGRFADPRLGFHHATLRALA